MLRRLGCKAPDVFKPHDKPLALALILSVLEFCFVTGQGEAHCVPELGWLPSGGWPECFCLASEESPPLSRGLHPSCAC